MCMHVHRKDPSMYVCSDHCFQCMDTSSVSVSLKVTGSPLVPTHYYVRFPRMPAHTYVDLQPDPTVGGCRVRRQRASRVEINPVIIGCNPRRLEMFGKHDCVVISVLVSAGCDTGRQLLT